MPAALLHVALLHVALLPVALLPVSLLPVSLLPVSLLPVVVKANLSSFTPNRDSLIITSLVIVKINAELE